MKPRFFHSAGMKNGEKSKISASYKSRPLGAGIFVGGVPPPPVAVKQNRECSYFTDKLSAVRPQCGPPEGFAPDAPTFALDNQIIWG